MPYWRTVQGYPRGVLVKGSLGEALWFRLYAVVHCRTGTRWYGPSTVWKEVYGGPRCRRRGE